MLNGSVALIGLGAIGTPIAHKMYRKYTERFALIASGERKKRLQNQKMTVNGEPFAPQIISSSEEMELPVGLLIVCVKNYQLENSIEDIQKVIDDNTIILPLQNGISSYEYFKQHFPHNRILQGYVQGPNTQIENGTFHYTNPGAVHIGGQVDSNLDIAADVYSFLSLAEIEVHLEQDIRHMVWKKWMLNVAGNSVTALTDADYSNFKDSPELQNLCTMAMKEFITVAKAEGVSLSEQDIQAILNYYINYNGSKRTSMLEDVSHRRKTENEYLAGKIIELAKLHHINAPVISSLYMLLKIKESLYLSEKTQI